MRHSFRIRRLVSWATIIGTSIAIIFVALSFRDFYRSLVSSHGIQVSDSRKEVLYRLGSPTHVMGPMEKIAFGSSQRVYSVNGPSHDQNTMPSGTSLNDYDEWSYEKPGRQGRFGVEFGEGGLVKSVTLYTKSSDQFAWGPIAGIRSGDSEEKILGLGKPTSSSINGVSKRIEFSDLGVRFTLTKARVYMVKINKLRPNKWSVLSRFLRSFL